jgi:dTDP-4-dehydrorhamnose reductase
VRILVTGTQGQVARALAERAAAKGVTVTCLGRPDLDLEDAVSIHRAITKAGGDVVVNAAAYTAVDQAEREPERAQAVNGAGAGHVAAAAAALGVPVIHLSTDYVYEGSLDRPYRETDPVGPVGAYGRSKLAGESAVAAANLDHVILRTAWVYSPFGRNFVKTMLHLAASRDEVSVVADQQGCPTYALDIADGVLAISRNLVNAPGDANLRGVFHMAGEGSTTWAAFAEHVMQVSAQRGGPHARVRAITTAEYPTPARRPANSRLDCRKLAQVHGVALPEWRASASLCVERLILEFNGATA